MGNKNDRGYGGQGGDPNVVYPAQNHVIKPDSAVHDPVPQHRLDFQARRKAGKVKNAATPGACGSPPEPSAPQEPQEPREPPKSATSPMNKVGAVTAVHLFKSGYWMALMHHGDERSRLGPFEMYFDYKTDAVTGRGTDNNSKASFEIYGSFDSHVHARTLLLSMVYEHNTSQEFAVSIECVYDSVKKEFVGNWSKQYGEHYDSDKIVIFFDDFHQANQLQQDTDDSKANSSQNLRNVQNAQNFQIFDSYIKGIYRVNDGSHAKMRLEKNVLCQMSFIQVRNYAKNSGIGLEKTDDKNVIIEKLIQKKFGCLQPRQSVPEIDQVKLEYEPSDQNNQQQLVLNPPDPAPAPEVSKDSEPN